MGLWEPFGHGRRLGILVSLFLFRNKRTVLSICHSDGDEKGDHHSVLSGDLTRIGALFFGRYFCVDGLWAMTRNLFLKVPSEPSSPHLWGQLTKK